MQWVQQGLRAAIDAVKGDDPNDYKLLNQFFARNPNVDQISVQQLYQHVREKQDERITKIFIQIFGYLSFLLVQAKLRQAKQLQDPKVQAKIERAKKLQGENTQSQTVKPATTILEDYPKKLKSIFDEVLAILNSAATLDPTHDKLVSDHTFSWLPAEQYSNFSWSLNHAIDATQPEEYLRRGLVLGVVTWPMSKSLAYLLDLERIPYIKQCLASWNARSSQAITDVYKYLVPAQPGIFIPFRFTLSGAEANVNLQAEEQNLTADEKGLRREECLLKLAAFAGFPVLNSWIDEIIAWGKKYDQMAKVSSLFSKFKLTHLIVDQTYLNTLSKSSQVSLRRIAPVRAEYEQAEQVPLVTKKPLSFQDYLIEKSLGYLQEEFSFSSTVYKVLKDLFKSHESERIHLLFVVYTLKTLFRTSDDDFDYRLHEMITASYQITPHAPNLIYTPPNLSKLFKIFATLLNSIQPTTAQYTRSFLALCFFKYHLKHHLKMEIKPAQQALLMDYFAALDASVMERTLAGLQGLLTRLPSHSCDSLSTLARTDLDPQAFFKCLLWEIYVRVHLPSICCIDFIALHATLPLEQFKEVHLCVYQWIQLYPHAQKKLDPDEQFTLFENDLPEKVAIGHTFSQSFSQGLTILKNHVLPTAPTYSFLHATLCFIFSDHYLNFSPQIQPVLFTAIQKTIDYFATLNASAIEKNLAGLKGLLTRLPSISYDSLSTLARTDLAPEAFFRCLLWEIYVRTHLPSICCKDFIELHSTLPLEQFKKVRLCVYQWLQLYPHAQKRLDLDEQLTLFENNLPERAAVEYTFSHSFSKGLTILKNHELPTASTYSFLHATLCLIYWNHYLNFSSQIQPVLFTALQRTSVEHRELCVDSWLKFGSCLPINAQTPTIQAARAYVLRKAYEAKSKTWIEGGEGLRQCLQQQPFPLERLMDVQVHFLQRVEHLIQGPVPLITYLMLLWYCPFFPDEFNDKSTCLSTLMENLQNLKTFSNLKHFKSLFIHPAWIKQCDNFTRIEDSHLLMSAMYYFNFSHGKKEHVSNLINYIGPIKSAISSAVLPALPFRENLCAQTEDLFKSGGKKFSTAQQNRVGHYADATMNGNIHAGEWHGIGCMIEWKLIGPNLVCSIVLWQSFYQLQSREIHIPLELPLSKLCSRLHSLLEKMLLTLGEDIADIQDPKERTHVEADIKNSKERARLEKELNRLKTLKETHKQLLPEEQAKVDQIERKLNLQTYLDKLTTTQEELDFCLKFYNDPLTVDYAKALADPSLQAEDLLSLFKFVKELKIQTRQAQADLLEHIPDQSTPLYTFEWLAGQGNVYHTTNGLSLVPPRFEAPAFYRIENTEWANELKDLVQRLRTAKDAFEISDLLNLPLSSDVQETVSVSFTPYLNPEFEPNEDMISSYLDQYEIGMPQLPVQSRSQTQILNELVHSDLDGLKEHVIKTGSIWLANQFYAQGWNVNQPLNSGTTPLVKAVQCHQTPFVLWLLLKGADPTLADKQELTPLAVAQQIEQEGNKGVNVLKQKIQIGTSETYKVNGRACNSLEEIKDAREKLKETAPLLQKTGQGLVKLLNDGARIKEHFLRVNELTFKLKDHEGVTYSCKLMDFLHHANLENFLRWKLLKLKSQYYKAQLPSTPHGYISTLLGIEERVAPLHLQTDSFENLKFEELLLPTCEPLNELMLQQNPPFKLQIADAKALYEESSIPVQTYSDYQQLQRFKPSERPSQALIGGAFVNNYPKTFPSGMINCDMFYVEQDLTFKFSILADGCNTGHRPREAAQRAIAGVVTYLHQHLNHPLYQLKTAQELACILVRSLAYAHDNMLKERDIADESGTTTINICFAFQDSKQKKHLITVGVGDSKAFLVHLDGDYQVEDVAERQHNNNDIKDPGGRLGPYGGNDHRSNDYHPDLRNLSISCCPLPDECIVFNMSDGVHDNFDPEILMKTPHQCDEAIEESKTWNELKKNDENKYNQLKTAYQKQTLSRLVREALEQKKQTPDEICEYITSYCHQITENKRKPMEEDANTREPYEPGKMDHCSIVAFKSQKTL